MNPHVGNQFYQLDMWKPAHELIHNTIPGDSNPGDNIPKLWNAKRSANIIGKMLKEKNAVYPESVAKEGVREPVRVYHPNATDTILQDGHHRAVAAYDHNPQTLVPVDHHWPGTSVASDLLHGLFEEAHSQPNVEGKGTRS